MAILSLADEIQALTPNEQESVRQFIHFLRERERFSTTPFLAAVEDFIDQHPELLRRLAQ